MCKRTYTIALDCDVNYLYTHVEQMTGYGTRDGGSDGTRRRAG